MVHVTADGLHADGSGQAVSWTELADEIDRLNRTEPRQGLERATAWLERERARGSREGELRALRAQTHALRFLGQYDHAIEQYEALERDFRAIGLEAEAARTAVGHVTALRYKGRYQEAADLAIETRELFLRLGDDLQAAKQAMNLGTVYRPMGRLRDAVATYLVARRVFRRLNERSWLADIEQNLGNVLVDLGEYARALRHLQAAERIRRQLGLRTEVALTLLNIGILLHRRGDYGQALRQLSQAREIYESAGVERGALLVDLQLLATCVALNLRDESTRVANRAIAGLRRLDVPYELGQALISAGSLAATAGDVGLARERTAEARAIFQKIGNRLWESLASVQEALIVAKGAQAGDEGLPGVAGEAAVPVRETLEEMLTACRAATVSLREAGALDRAALGLFVEGAILARLGQAAEAERCFEQARIAATRLNADHLLFQAYEALGELHEDTDPKAAIESYRRAIDHLETVRSRALVADLKVAFLTDKASVYERLVALLLDTSADEPAPAAVAEAYDYVERSKSRTLLEDLLSPGAQRPTGARPSGLAIQVQRVRDLRTRLNSAYLEVYGADAVPTPDSVARRHGGASIPELEQELAQATRELQLASSPGERIGLADQLDSPPSARPIEGVTLIELYGAAGTLLAFVRRGHEIVLRTLAPLAEVERLVERLSFQIGHCAAGGEHVMANRASLRRSMDRCLQQLYDAIVAPLSSVLPETGSLVIVPHGSLHGIPFHALYDGTGYLAERYTITYAPSAGVFEACRRSSRPFGRRLLAVGIDDPGLPWVVREIESVATTWEGARVLSGRRATSRALWRQAGSFDVLHLATHGVFRADNPAFSSVKLADAWLTVADLAEVARGAQLVTLSACETGVSGLSAGDEVVGLTRGLLAAGCTAVIASLWTVSDQSTAHLMERLYRGLGDGQRPAAALGAAMNEVRAEYDHPYFWAPFVVSGSGLDVAVATSEAPAAQAVTSA